MYVTKQNKPGQKKVIEEFVSQVIVVDRSYYQNGYWGTWDFNTYHVTHIMFSVTLGSLSFF